MRRQLRSAATIAAVAAGSTLLVALAARPTLAGGGPAAYPLAGPSLSAVPTTVAPVTPSATPGPQWIPAPCATGDLNPLEVDAGGNVVVPGQATICAGRWDSKYSFTLVAFRSDRDVAFALPTGLRPYEPAGPTGVRGAFVTPPGVGSTGVCLMRSTNVRMACVAIEVTPTQQITYRAVATDDPLVTKPVIFQYDEITPAPGSGWCATCVGLR